MDVFELKKTPIRHLYEVAVLEPFPPRAVIEIGYEQSCGFLQTYIPNIRAFFKFLGISASDESFINPQSNPWWHTDSLDDKPDPQSQIFGVATWEGHGTLFKQNGREFQGLRWRLYLMAQDIEHSSPLNEQRIERLLLRFRFNRGELKWA